jgi:hypothetical protein
MSQDPVITDGDKYKGILENERVRVLEYYNTLGQKTSMHHHSAFVLHALTPFKRKLTLGDGRTVMGEFKAGEVLWSPAKPTLGRMSGLQRLMS